MNKNAQTSIFESTKTNNIPLAARMRPETLSQFVGQSHLIYDGSLLTRAIKSDRLGSCIFWGAPGTGKTSLANIIANSTGSNFVKLNAVSSGVSDAKKVIDDATRAFNAYGQRTYLLLDECHRWSKSQSDCILPAIESGVITFIGSTTENPFVSMTRAIVSRCRIFEFNSLTQAEIASALDRALSQDVVFGKMNIHLEEDARNYIADTASGDLRNAYNALELAVLTTNVNADGVIVIDKLSASQSMQKKIHSVDDQLYYDMLSAFIKSMRGSSSDGAMFWFERLVQSGCDPMLLARRIIVHASEDVGLADPQALVVAVSAMTALQNIGLPEARIPLAQAILYICNAPKSNSVVEALYSASATAQVHPTERVPYHLCDRNFPRESDNSKMTPYKYPHDYGGYVEQQYLPDSLVDSQFYFPTNNGSDTGCKQKK